MHHMDNINEPAYLPCELSDETCFESICEQSKKVLFSTLRGILLYDQPVLIFQVFLAHGRHLNGTHGLRIRISEYCKCNTNCHFALAIFQPDSHSVWQCPEQPRETIVIWITLTYPFLSITA